MAARCTNGHTTPPNGPCMYCGAALVPTPMPMAMPMAAPQGPPPPVPPESGSMSALAIVSLILGLLFPVGSVPAIVVGLIALPRIRKRNQDGRGFAIAGIALGGIAVALAVAAALAVWSVGDDTDSAKSQACVTDSRTLITASEAFYAQTGRYPLTMDELVDANFLNQESERYRLKPNNQAMPDFVPIDGACGGVTVYGD